MKFQLAIAYFTLSFSLAQCGNIHVFKNSENQSRRSLQDGLTISPSSSTVPSEMTSSIPSAVPSEFPSNVTSERPSMFLSALPSKLPSLSPTLVFSNVPSKIPSLTPTLVESNVPSLLPTSSLVPTFSALPTSTPSLAPSWTPSVLPSLIPTKTPSVSPSTSHPTSTPTTNPSILPSTIPSSTPSILPSTTPSSTPTRSPTATPSFFPSSLPSQSPSVDPTSSPSVLPSKIPTFAPSKIPSLQPSYEPSNIPTLTPSLAPSFFPSELPTLYPTMNPSMVPTISQEPSVNPTSTPSALPSISNHPTGGPTVSSHPSISFEPSLTQQPSSSPTDECYDNWFDFATDVEDADDNSVFVVCPNTLLIPLDEYFDGFLIHEIFVYASNILLMCGRDGDLANNCTFSGPSISYLYFHEDYSINGAIVSGFTFDGANDTSVSIWSNADDLYSTSVTFRECRWLNNNGQDGGAVNVWQAEVHFENCTFEGNISPMGSGIFNDDGVVYVDHSTFENNAGNGWAIEAWGNNSVTYITESCFIHNTGGIFVDNGSSLGNNMNNFVAERSNENEEFGFCHEIYIWDTAECIKVDSDKCIASSYVNSNSPSVTTTSEPTVYQAFPSSMPTITDRPTISAFPTSTPSVTPSKLPTKIPTLKDTNDPTLRLDDCISNWNMLKLLVESSRGNETFSVCSGSTLIPDYYDADLNLLPHTEYLDGSQHSHILIEQHGIKIVCEQNEVEGCLFDGGITHLFVFSESDIDVTVDGFTFKNSSNTSVIVAGTPDSTTTFRNCFWEGNTGVWGGAIGLWSYGDARESTLPSEGGQFLRVYDSSFIGNQGNQGSGILVEHGVAEIKNSTFLGNEAFGWPIEILYGFGSISNCCFSDSPGSVYVYNTGDFLQTENFASGDKIDTYYNCSGVFDELVDECIPFTGESCESVQMTYDTFPPTMSPRRSPDNLPTAQPQPVKSISNKSYNLALFILPIFCSLFLI